jgi:hypothetical protein
MAQTFEERVEEVLGLLHGMAWPLLEEADKRKVIAKVAKGIDRGDTAAAWGRALGCDRTTVARWVERFRKSEPIDGVRPAPETVARRFRAAKQTLSDPVLVEQLYEDPTARRVLRNAAFEHEQKVETEVKAESKKRAPELHHRMGWNEVAGDLLRVRQLFGKALDAAKELELDAEEAAALEDDLKKIAAIGEWFESFLKSGASDFDTELSKILEG